MGYTFELIILFTLGELYRPKLSVFYPKETDIVEDCSTGDGGGKGRGYGGAVGVVEAEFAERAGDGRSSSVL